jgi:hypothetical protein
MTDQNIRYYKLPENHPGYRSSREFGIKVTGGSDELCHIKFTVYEIVNQEPEAYLEGSVKWDGCVNYSYVNKNCALHTCCPEMAIAETTLVMNMVWKVAVEGMPTKHDKLDPIELVETNLEEIHSPY